MINPPSSSEVGTWNLIQESMNNLSKDFSAWVKGLQVAHQTFADSAFAKSNEIVQDMSNAFGEVMYQSTKGKMMMRAMVILGTSAIISITTFGFRSLWSFVRRKAIVVVEFDSTDESYRWLIDWISDHGYAADAEEFLVTTERKGLQDRPSRRRFKVEPGGGVFYFQYGGRRLRLTRVLGNEPGREEGPGRARRETLRFEFLGRGGSHALVNALVEEAMQYSLQKDQSQTVVYVGDQYGSWRRSTAAAKRPISSVILADGVLEGILADVQRFIDQQEWYAARGIPYRRGYLLHGPPGCGKSSLIRALAGELGVDIYVINLSSKFLNDEIVAELMRDVPYHGLVLLEDVDSIFAGSGIESGSDAGSSDVESLVPSCNITYGGLLNAIDGVASQEGRILFLTTNHPERLRPSLVRPGRVDVRLPIGLCTRSQARRMLLRFYPDEPESLARHLADNFVENVFSMAQLQAIFMDHRESAVECVDAILAQCNQLDAVMMANSQVCE